MNSKTWKRIGVGSGRHEILLLLLLRNPDLTLLRRFSHTIMTIFPGMILAFLHLAIGPDRADLPQNFAFFEPVRPPRAI